MDIKSGGQGYSVQKWLSRQLQSKEIAFTTHKRPCISGEAGTSHVAKVGRFRTQAVFRNCSVKNQGLVFFFFSSFSVGKHVAWILAQFRVLRVRFHCSPSPAHVSLSLSLNMIHAPQAWTSVLCQPFLRSCCVTDGQIGIYWGHARTPMVFMALGRPSLHSCRATSKYSTVRCVSTPRRRRIY